MTLILDNNDFEENKGIKFATKCIESNDELHRFDWVNNQINNQEDAHHLLKSVIDNPSIDEVRLENCLGGGDINSYDALCSLLAREKRVWRLILIITTSRQRVGRRYQTTLQAIHHSMFYTWQAIS